MKVNKRAFQVYQAEARLSGKHPLLVTGVPRSGKSTLTQALIKTRNFRRIHEPFSNYRGSDHKSTIVKNLKHTFTYINDENAWLYAADTSALLDYFAYSYRVATDGGATAKKMLSYLRNVSLRYFYQWRQPLIDDPFLVLSVPWLRKTLRWNIVIMTRNPVDFVAVRKLQNFGFDIGHFARQEALLKGPLLSYSREVNDLAANTSQLSLPMQNAYLWKFIHVCVLQYTEMFPEITFLRFEDMKADGFKHFCRAIRELYNMKIPNHSNPFLAFENVPDGILTKQEQSEVAEITEPTASKLYSMF